jgi:hypothetical protein
MNEQTTQNEELSIRTGIKAGEDDGSQIGSGHVVEGGGTMGSGGRQGGSGG